jgi:hypothetical protein
MLWQFASLPSVTLGRGCHKMAAPSFIREGAEEKMEKQIIKTIQRHLGQADIRIRGGKSVNSPAWLWNK